MPGEDMDNGVPSRQNLWSNQHNQEAQPSTISLCVKWPPAEACRLDVVKYLGVQISYDLRWDKHIDYITSKANSTLGFLRRNINISNAQIEENSKTLARQILEYSQWRI